MSSSSGMVHPGISHTLQDEQACCIQLTNSKLLVAAVAWYVPP